MVDDTITDHGDRIDMLDALSITINRATYLKAWCDDNGDPNATKLETTLRDLQSQYTKLSRAIWLDWVGDAATVKNDLNTAAAGAQSCVNDIKNMVSTAQNVVKALGYADQALQVALKLLA